MAGVMNLRMACPHWSAHCSYSLFGMGILLCKEVPQQECDECLIIPWLSCPHWSFHCPYSLFAVGILLCAML